MRRAALALVALLLATSAAAQRQPWEWTLDERLADRFNPAKVREREAAGDPRETPGSTDRVFDPADIAPGRPFEYRIDGRRNPELFLSFELFDSLLSGLSPQDSMRSGQRRFISKSIRSFGYDEQKFWSSLESVSAIYLGVKEKSCADKACIDARCSARYDALEAARQLFGPEEFNRFLYVVVAPNKQLALASLYKGHRESLRRQESGCR